MIYALQVEINLR